MRNYFSFGGTPSTDYGVYISGTGVFDAPARSYNPITVPGRNGDVLLSEKRLENIELTYPAFTCRDFAANMRSIKAFLLSQIGYQRLTDTYYPDEYRLAYYGGGMNVEPTAVLDAGKFEIKFICKPQRYLISGETETTFTADGTINNPTLFDAMPLIRVYGTGSFTVNGVTFTISSNPTYTDIDCETMDCYCGTTSRNSFVTLSENDFPVLSPGDNTVSLDGVTSVAIKPRWWQV